MPPEGCAKRKTTSSELGTYLALRLLRNYNLTHKTTSKVCWQNASVQNPTAPSLDSRALFNLEKIPLTDIFSH